MGPVVQLAPLEGRHPDTGSRVGRPVSGADHPQTFRPCQRAQPPTQIYEPRWTRVARVLLDRLSPGNDVEPLGVGTQVLNPREESGRGTGCIEPSAHIHGGIRTLS